jgi:hypothetical protein
VGGVEDCVELGGAGVEGEGGVSGVVVSEVRVLCCEEAVMLSCCALHAYENVSTFLFTTTAKHRESISENESHLLQLLIQIARPLMESHHARHTHRTALQVRHASRDPVRTHAHSRKPVDTSFCAQVVDLLRGGIQFEERVVNGARDGLGERVFGPLAAFDGGDGGGDYVGPFGVGVAGCWGHCLGDVLLLLEG